MESWTASAEEASRRTPVSDEVVGQFSSPSSRRAPRGGPRGSAHGNYGASSHENMLRVGFVPLIDAAPLIAALELGYFAEEGISVSLEKQIGWGNVRDKLTFGHLQAAHALVGMPLWSALGLERFVEPLVSVMGLGSGGNAITLSKRLTDLGVRSASTLAQFVRPLPANRKPTMAYVFSCSMHHYLLREWLANNGIDPESDVKLCVLPPPQLAEQISRGAVDAMCVGEPWGSQAVRSNVGSIVARTTELLPKHPEKVLATSARFAKANGAVLERMIRAVIRACDFCEQAGNHTELAKMLSAEKYINLPADVLLESLRMKTSIPGVAFRSFSRECTFPNATHVLWMMEQAERWGHVRFEGDRTEMAQRCVDSAAHRRAAQSLGMSCPETDFAAMPMRTGFWKPAEQKKVLIAGAMSGAVS